MKVRAVASAPAKVILLGEHFVVHGEPAIVLAIDKRATVSAELRGDKKVWIRSKTMNASGYFLGERFRGKEGGEDARKRLEPVRVVASALLEHSRKDLGLSLEIDSSIPAAAGLGSSAAVAVASAAALSHLLGAGLTRDEIFRVAFDAEKVVHGTPSGVDPAISTYGGVIRYRKGEEIKRLDIEVDLPLVIGDTEIERSTGKMVGKVADLKKRYPFIVDKIIRAGGEIVATSTEALKSGDLQTLGEMMNMNHALLYALGVSSQPLETLVYAARKEGALGAKLTGAGGGGCMIALAVQEKLKDVADAIERAGGEVFVTKKTADGVRIEQ